jgi:16S rRNA (adenine1518-N6/adenine1519-N6)-dimethyltransferase
MPYKPKKSLGQNFMLSSQIASHLVYALNLSEDDFVVEIGAGLGAVTQKLSEALYSHESRIYAVEIDPRFIPKLREMFKPTLNVTPVEADILNWLPEQLFTKEFKVLGSLPYYITSPILHMLAKLKQRPVRSVLLIQKEVAEKLVETAPKASYISTFMHTFFDVSYLKTVPRDVFRPVPKVDGAIISLDKKELEDYFSDPDIVRRYEGFLHKGFSSPRKMLNKPFTDAELDKVNVNGSLRPQDLPVSVWKSMFEALVLENL